MNDEKTISDRERTPSDFPWKLWLYTNYDCNLKCSYCLAESTPTAPRRALGLANVQRLVDEAVELGFNEVFFTGGEPFILDDIYDMLAYSSIRVKTSVLTNAMLLRRRRLERLLDVANENLVVQVSLDGGAPEQVAEQCQRCRIHALVLSFIVLYCPVLLVLSCLASPCLVLSCLVLSCLALSCLAV